GLKTADPEAMRPAIYAAVQEARPDWVLVYGDTNSTLAGTEAAVAAGVPVAHAEAGLRSGDLSMPEERNRIAVDRISALLLPPGNVRLLDPLGYLDMAALASQARVIVTDSGGLQKEAYWYGVPCVTARPSTEWIDTVEAGANVLVDDDPERLAAAVAAARMPEERPELYGDGRASERVAAALLGSLPGS